LLLETLHLKFSCLLLFLMQSDFTQAQGSDELLRAIQLSQRSQPPCEVPGYEIRRFLGSGAYGEVWVGTDRTTGRQVAIKFYLHRGGLDWSLLSHEVEKLAFLSADRYVVQLLDVGWDAEPPYYVMEYVEQGSLDQRLQKQGRMPPAEATSMLREITVGLMHAHSKGVLHCDLKPANVLLDQDGKPRLADFGQSRLSHEQTPALGTLFYMAPEQADPQAVPDARWDVYALGAMLYAMLTGSPPHRSEQNASQIEAAPDLDQRLARYRKLIVQAPPAVGHRQISGVDKPLAEIIDRCLAADPRQRFPTVQAVLDALDARARRRSHRPLVVLGALGPVLLVTVMSVLAWQWFTTSLARSRDALIDQSLEALNFAARSVATGAAKDLEMRFRDVEEVAGDSQIIQSLGALETDPATRPLLEQLSDPKQEAQAFNDLRDKLRLTSQSESMEARLKYFNKLTTEKTKAEISSWFINDAYGTQVARWPASGNTLGRNFAWRSYFHGGPADHSRGWRPEADEHLQATQLSAVYTSDSSDLWVVSISSPIFSTSADGAKKFLGVVSMSFNVGERFIALPAVDPTEAANRANQFAVLVDARVVDHSGDSKGKDPGFVILQHPLFDEVIKNDGQLPERFFSYKLPAETMAALSAGESNFHDPLAADKEGHAYQQRYLAAQAPIVVRDNPTGWIVLVQDSYNQAIGATLAELSGSLVFSGVVALGVIAVVILGMWWLVIRMLEEPTRWRPPAVAAKTKAADTLPIRNPQKV
jgi:hypothetical protein